MSSPFYQVAKKMIKPIVEPLGFHSKDRFFYRIVNNVVEQFCLLWLQRDFTIRFYISSVYNENDRTIEGDEIHRLIDGSNNWLGAKYYQIGNRLFCDNPFAALTPEAFQNAADICICTLEEYLLPWFSQIKNSQDAYKALLEINSITTAQDNDPGSDQEIGFLLDMGKYEAVSEILSFYIRNSDKYNQNWWQEIGPEYQKLNRAIADNDHFYIQYYMKQKKLNTYAEFKWKEQ